MLVTGLALGLTLPAAAKVAFTGYGNMQMTAHQQARIFGDPPALAAFKLAGSQDVHTRGMNLESVGLFATTSITATAIQSTPAWLGTIARQKFSPASLHRSLHSVVTNCPAGGACGGGLKLAFSRCRGIIASRGTG